MKRLLTNWPLDEEKATGKIIEFRSLYESNGHDRFAQCVQNIIHGSEYRFFPSVGEFLGHMPKQNRAFWRDPHCACRGTGFVDAGRDPEMNRQVRRCPNPECLHITAGAA